MKQCYFGLLAGLALLTGCHKDAAITSYTLSGKYVADNTLVAANSITMYTKNGQVTNQAVVTRFLARKQWLTSYFSPTDEPINTGSTLSLAFRANNRAALLTTAPGYIDSIQTEVLDKQANTFILQNLDSVGYFGSATSGCSVRLAQLADYIKNFYPKKHCQNVSPATGYSQYCQQWPLRVVKVRDGQLFIPYYSWYVQANSCYLAYRAEWNTFNPAILNQLAAGDTVVVQEREIRLRK